MASIKKLPSGKWRALIRKLDVSGLLVTKSGTFQYKPQAQAWATDIESKIASGQITAVSKSASSLDTAGTAPALGLLPPGRGFSPPGRGLSFNQVINIWIDEYANHQGDGYLDNIRWIFRFGEVADDRAKWLNQFPTQCLCSLHHYRNFITYLQDLGLGPRSIHDRIQLLRKILRWAHHNGHIETDCYTVAHRLVIPGYKKESGREYRVPPKDEQALIDAALRLSDRAAHTPHPKLKNGNSVGRFNRSSTTGGVHPKSLRVVDTYKKFALMIPLAVETAMRASELAFTPLSNWDRKRRTFLLPKTKNRKRRLVPLSKRATECMEELTTRWPEQDTLYQQTISQFSTLFAKIADEAGLPHIHFHDLRHEATSRLFERGWNPIQVQAVTGHSSLQMLARYTHLQSDSLVSLLDETDN